MLTIYTSQGCSTRSESQGIYIGYTSAKKCGFETQRRRHQKSEIWILAGGTRWKEYSTYSIHCGASGFLRVRPNAFWSHQCPCHFPKIDGIMFEWLASQLVHNLPWWCYRFLENTWRTISTKNLEKKQKFFSFTIDWLVKYWVTFLRQNSFKQGNVMVETSQLLRYHPDSVHWTIWESRMSEKFP